VMPAPEDRSFEQTNPAPAQQAQPR
jgi:hypothetical protein